VRNAASLLSQPGERKGPFALKGGAKWPSPAAMRF